MKRLFILLLIIFLQQIHPCKLSADSTVKVGIYNNKPLIFIDSEGNGKGVFADILEYIASNEGWQIEYIAGTWQQGLSRLNKRKIDILCTITSSPERKKLYDFSKENLLTNWAQIYTPLGSEIRAITDVAGKKIAALKGDIHYSFFTQMVDRFGIEPEFIETADYQSVLDLVSRRQADAGIVNRFFGMQYGKKYNVNKSGVIFNPLKIYYAAPKGNAKGYIATIDRYIPLLKEDEGSVYYQSLDKWFGTISTTGWAFPKWTKWTFLVGAGLVILLFLGNIVLRNQVKEKTESLNLELERRKKAEETLREREKHFRELTEMLPEAVFEADADFNLSYANRRAFELFGYSRTDFTNLNSFELLIPEERDRAKKNFSMRLKGKNPGTVEYRAARKDGSTFPILLHASAVMKDSALFGIRGIIVDISELKRVDEKKMLIEEQYRQAQKLEAIGRLAGGVAHDLNNLLTPIIGYSEILMDDFGPDDDRKQSLNEIVHAGIRARNLVRQLLAFGRKQTFKFRLLDLNQTINGINKLIQRTIREDIEVKILPGYPLRLVKADVGQIEQVIINLVLNAQDAMPDGGKLTLETAMADFDDEYVKTHLEVKTGKYVLLTVSDMGCGMDEEIRKNIFEPFFTTKGEQGTGLGLATVYGIIKQHGGHIRVCSEPGKGTHFKVYLPVSEEIDVKQEEVEKIDVDLRGSETILLVEDDKSVRHLANTILKRNGYTLLVAESGMAALDIIASYNGPLDLVLTDVVMPEMNGIDLVKKVSDIFPGTRVLFMSGYSDNIIAQQGVLVEGVQFISKPFTVQGLANKVREVLDQDRLD